MRRSVALALVLWLCATGSGCAQTRTLGGDTLVVRSTTGLELRVVAANPDPALRVVLPGSDTADRAIEVLFPEHVTALQHGRAVAEHLVAWPIRTPGYFNVIAKVIGPEALGSSSDIGFTRTTVESLSLAA